MMSDALYSVAPIFCLQPMSGMGFIATAGTSPLDSRQRPISVNWTYGSYSKYSGCSDGSFVETTTVGSWPIVAQPACQANRDVNNRRSDAMTSAA